MRIEPYGNDRHNEWQRFVGSAKNATFLFQRDYMEYHADRFKDASLMCYDDNTLLACLPANLEGDVVSSHGGLTYGGFITDHRMKTKKMLELFEATCAYYRRQGVKQFIYKPLPHIYHLMPAEEDLYALFRFDATLIGRSVSSTYRADTRRNYSKGRKSCIKKGKSGPLKIAECQTASAVMQLVEQWLKHRFNITPTHTAAEMELLMQRFPSNIRVFAALDANGAAQAGIVIYETPRVAHCQYIIASDNGRNQCAPDLLITHLLENIYADKPFFDWGISCTKNGRCLSDHLILNKESFGGRAICYDCYRIML